MMKTTVMACLTVLMAAGLAGAASTVTLTGSVDATNWYVYAQVAGAPDNDGIHGVAFSVSGVRQQVNACVAPQVTDWLGDGTDTPVGTYGFISRRCDVMAPNTLDISCSGGNSSSTYVMKHLGQQTVTVTSMGMNGETVTTTIGCPLLVAKGVLQPGMVPAFTGAHSASVWATGTYDPQGCAVVEANVNALRQFLPLAGTPPTVTFTAPAPGYVAAAGSTVNVTATASPGAPGGSITGVEFFEGTMKLGNGVFDAGSGAWTYAWNTTGLSQFTHHVDAKATDSFGMSSVADPSTYINVVGRPAIVSATSTSLTKVSVVFSKNVDQATATNIANYVISDGISLTGATCTDGRTANLTTSAMAAGGQYTLTVNNIQDRSESPIPIAPDSKVTFTCLVTPTIASATASDFASVNVVFSRPMDPATATTIANYAINGGVSVTGATMADETTVTLATSAMAVGASYTLTVNNILDTLVPPIMVAPNTTKAFRAPSAPTINSATCTTLTEVRVGFSKPVDATTAADVGNYAISGGITVTGATIVNTTTVSLATSAMVGSMQYTLTVNNVLDTLVPPLMITPNSTKAFTGAEGPTISTATATSAGCVRVYFSKAVTAETAANTANYAISGGVTVTGATLDADQRTVTLITSVMGGGTTHTLTAYNITDTLVPPIIMPSSTKSFMTPPAPAISSATATSAGRVAVVFSKPVSAATATNVANYSISYGYATSVMVTGATVIDASTVVLSTSTMEADTSHRLTVYSIADTLAPPTVAPSMTKSFTTPASPTISSATATSAQCVAVVFSMPVSSAFATDLANYSLTGGVTVTGAVMVGTSTVALATSTLSPNTSYTLTARNIADTTTPPFINASATSYFTTPYGPVISSVTATSLGYVRVVFSKPVSAASATNTANYAISSGAKVTGATMIDPSTVGLTTSSMISNSYYNLTASNIVDTLAPPFTATSSGNFTSPVAPMIYLVTATSPTEVRVQFSQPVAAASATNAANYAISGGVTVSGATIVDSSTVALATSTLAGHTRYTVTAYNIANTLAPPSITPSTSSGFTTPGPYITSASATSPESVRVDFSTTVAVATATNVDNYSISGGIAVTGVTWVNSSRVMLATSTMAGHTSYTVTAANIADTSAPAFVTPTSTYSFTSQGPYMVTVTVKSAASVQVHFSRPVTGETAGNTANYSISGGVVVTEALWNSIDYVTLTTSTMSPGTQYTVTASNIADSTASPFTTPASSLTFTTPNARFISGASATNAGSINLWFPGAVGSTTATNIANYTVSGGVTVTGATMVDVGRVDLATSTLAGSTSYTVTASNIGDALAPPFIGPPSSRTFNTPAGPTINSASPTSAGCVRVYFNEAVSAASATNIANYAITGGVIVTGVTMIDAQSVALATSPMSASTNYTLTVSGIADTAVPPFIAPTLAARFGTADAPTISGANATDARTVRVWFSKAVDPAMAANVASYSISGGIAVTGATIYDAHTADLATSTLAAGTNYTLTAVNIADTLAPPYVTPSSTRNFTTPSGPYISSATATSAAYVSVVFSQAVSAATATNVANYLISGGVAVTGASMTSSTTVVLATSPMAPKTSYTLAAYNISDTLVPPFTRRTSAQTFTTPSALALGATTTSLTAVRVGFSKPVDAVTAANPANYAVSGGITVISATVLNSSTVSLATSPMTPGLSYTLTVNNVRDTLAPPYVIAPNSLVTFWSYGPRISSASSTGLNAIQVQFSEVITASSATDAANYAVSRGVAVTGALLGADQRTVMLAVSPMDMSTQYALTARNITDTLAPPITTPSSTAGFYTPSPPTLSSASATNLVNVNVTFSNAVDPAAAANPTNYAISGGVIVTGAAMTSANQVQLAAAAMTPSATYTLTAYSITDVSGPPLATPSGTAMFIAPAAPKISSVSCAELEIVKVTFSRNVSPATATNAANYSISGGVVVTGAAMSGGINNVVYLNTSLLSAGSQYTLTVNGVQDSPTSPPISIAPGSTAVFTCAAGPYVSSASATSRDTVGVTFSKAVGAASAANPASYAVSGGIAVTSATQVDATHVSLATSTLDFNTAYTLTALNIADTGAITTPSSTAAFTSPGPLRILSTTATNLYSAQLTFSRALSAATATNTATYAISGGIAVTGATWDGSAGVVLATTEMAPAKGYALTVTNMTDALVPPITTPSIVGTISTPSAPSVYSVAAPSAASITVRFSEAVSAATATNVANYAVSDGVAVTGVVMVDSQNVTLATSPMAGHGQYILSAYNIADTLLPPITTAVSTKAFTSPGAYVTSATHSGACGVKVTFSKDVAPEIALNIASYAISGGVTVNSSLWVDTTHVLLVTSPMAANTTYTLTAFNIADTASPAATTPTSTAAFTTPGARISSVTVLGLGQVRLRFGESVDPASALNVSNYSVSQDIAVTGVSLFSSSEVVLATSPMTPAAQYTAAAYNIADTFSPPFVTASSTRAFTAPVAPTLVSAANLDPTRVALVFSKSMSAATVSNVANYSISGGVVVTGAAPGPDNTVTLTVSPMTAGAAYTVSVSNVGDTLAPPTPMDPNPSTAMFIARPVLALYTFPIAAADGDTGPGYYPTYAAPGLDGAVDMRIARGPGLSGLQISDFGGVGTILQVRPNGCTTVASAIAGGDYFEFSVKVQPGQLLVLTSIEFDAAGVSSATPRGWGLQTSIDGLGAGKLVVQSSSASSVLPATVHYAVDLRASRFQGLTDTVTFRLYGYTAGAGNSLGFRNVTLYGAITPMTEPPTVAITSPTSTHVAGLGGTVNLVATASTTVAGATIAAVEFFDGNAFIGTATDAGGGAYTFAWSSVGEPAGLHDVTARAIDSFWMPAFSSPATEIEFVPVPPPTVAITSPTSTYTAIVGSTISLVATASTTFPGASIAAVEFYCGTTKIGNGAFDAASGTWNLAWKSSFVVQTAIAGTITFNVYAGDTLLWNVGLDSPWCRKVPHGPNQVEYLIEDYGYRGGGDMDFDDIDILVTYDDLGRPISIKILPGESGYSFDMLINGIVAVHDIRIHANETLTLVNTIPPVYPITARATDSFGMSATSDPPTMIQLLSPPSVAITSPTSTYVAGIGTTVNFVATASTSLPDVRISRIEFFDGATKIGDGMINGVDDWLSGTRTYAWDTTGAACGLHAITAKATDSLGQTAVSAPATVVQVRLPGDTNGDGCVDDLDYTEWHDGYQQPNPTFSTGDFNGDGSVDGLDYNIWQNCYKHTATYASADFGPAAAGDGPAAPASSTTTSQAATTVPPPAAAGAGSPHLIAMTSVPGASVSGVMTLTLVFDRAVQVGAGAVEVSGMATGQNRDFAMAYDAASKSLTLTWTKTLAPDVYSVRVVADFVTAADGGAPLDGEVGDPAAPTLPSGDGAVGGDAWLEFTAEQ